MWMSDYDSLFAGKNGHVIIDEERIIDFALEKGRLILSSRAGEGKTCMLRRLYIHALQRGIAPVLMDLKQWSPSHYEMWKRWTSKSVTDGADFLLTTFSDTKFGILELDQLPPSVDKLILVDGLNEIATATGSQVLEIVDSLVRNQMRTSVLVADRSVRRDLPSAGRWTVGTILPLERKELLTFRSDLEYVNAAVLKSPFFLNASLKSKAETNAAGTSRTIALSERLALTLTQDELAATAKAAYDAYFASKSRLFDLNRFQKAAGKEVVRKLLSSSDLEDAGNGDASFSHHIVHDYLCSLYLASLPAFEWTPAVFSAVSFDSASFDAIALAFEQLDEGRADTFLRALYDWNLYAAGYALGQISANEGSASLHLRTMIYAMLAEKRFDPVVATRQRANDALMLMKFEDAKPFQVAPSFDAVLDALSAVGGESNWFDEWKTLFLTRRADHVDLDRLQVLKDPDSVTGWTMANVAKRAMVDERDVVELGTWLSTSSATVRWRIIHVLGGHPYKASIAVLSATLDDDIDQNVRYGAVRSLVELAARGGTELGREVARILIGRARKIMEQPRIRRELQNAIVLDRTVAPPKWLDFATEVIRAFYVEADAIEVRDEWRATLTAVETQCLSST
jgi:hypothetical protein